ncbi:CHAT domain-containing protein [Flavobacterium sp. 245]|uniref:CHAT domain-containing protein n=1 Tax=Flavobacterium sp. 245 TaxID=2512115 RepID=UPI00105E9E9C|nr:CHAT domain-containing protein [Flavobacterium sp. 245]TDO97105.1 CHAT domain-containing protein [Flavobacterium sp. 245]
MRIRNIERTNILYIVLIDEYEMELPFVPPANVNFKSLDFLKFLPKNLYQLYDPIFYAVSEVNYLNYNPYTVAFYKRSDRELVIKLLEETRQVAVVLIEENRAEDQQLKEIVKELGSKFVYFLNLDHDKDFSGTSCIFDLLSELTQDEEIYKHFNIIHEEPRLYLSTVYQENELKYHTNFLPTKTNFLTYNNYLGNFGSPDEVTDKQLTNIRIKAAKERDSFNRLNLFIDQSKEFDKLFSKLKLFENFEQQRGQLNPIFFCLPFHNPDVADFYTDKSSPIFGKIMEALQVEQSSNYVITVNDIEENQVFYGTGGKLLQERLIFLDSTCFLLASFNLMPYIRLPIKGKSLYSDLSFISPKHFDKFTILKEKLKISDTLGKIGDSISESVLSDEFRTYLAGRNSQIISVTDLPFEWLRIDNIPLSFTHDITRIPETSFNNQIISFAVNSMMDFKISENIISKTLVVLGTDDDEFIKWHSILYEMSEKHNFIVVTCASNDEFLEVLRKHNPDFLIIDTHGGVNKETKETFLHMGSDDLTYEFITANNIVVPLVFLSACGTAPIYGTFNSIANAFLQCGSRSVTSTYLPVEADNATMAYLAILNNLDKVAREGRFKNWLEYICYSNRSTFLHRIYGPILLDEQIDKETKKEYFKLAQDILVFSRRKHVFKAAERLLKSLPTRKANILKPKAYEFLYYTNIGRGDLVLFKKHVEDFEKSNNVSGERALSSKFSAG